MKSKTVYKRAYKMEVQMEIGVCVCVYIYIVFMCVEFFPLIKFYTFTDSFIYNLIIFKDCRFFLHLLHIIDLFKIIIFYK